MRAGDHQLTGCGGIEGECAHRERAGAGQPERVVGVDGGERGIDTVGRDPSRDAGRHETGLMMQPGEVGGLDRVEQVAAALHLASDGVEAGRRGRGRHARVPVSRSTEPPVKVSTRVS